MTHICVSKQTIIGSYNGLSPGRRQAIIWTNAGILLIGTNFSEILMGIQTFSFKKIHLKVSSANWRPFCLGLNVLIHAIQWLTLNIQSVILLCLRVHPLYTSSLFGHGENRHHENYKSTHLVNTTSNVIIWTLICKRHSCRTRLNQTHADTINIYVLVMSADIYT